MKTKYKHVHFIGMVKFEKTSVYECFNNTTDHSIGIVAWYSPWQQYCYYPETDTVYSPDDLNDIAKFTEQLKVK